MFSPIPYCTLGKRDLGTLGNLPRDIQLAGNRGAMWNQAVWLQDLSLSSSALPWPIEGSGHRTTSHHCLTPWPRILYFGGSPHSWSICKGVCGTSVGPPSHWSMLLAFYGQHHDVPNLNCSSQNVIASPVGKVNWLIEIQINHII